MPHILILGVGDDRESAFRAFLENHGFITYVGSTYFNNYSRLVHQAIFYDHMSGDEERLIEQLKEIHHRRPFDAVFTLSELSVELANKVAGSLDLPGNTLEVIKKCRNKYLAREAFRIHGLQSPRYSLVQTKEDVIRFMEGLEGENTPVVIKPTDNGGSVGVVKVNHVDELDQKFTLALQNSFNKCLIIEEYIEGPEYSVEVLVQQGEIDILTITDKIISTKNDHFVEMGHIVPSLLEQKEQEKVKELAKEALEAVGYKHGAAHVEVKKSKGEYYLIEVNARTAGDLIPDLLSHSFQWNFYEALLHVHLGQPYEPIGEPKYFSAITFFHDEGKNQSIIQFPKQDELDFSLLDIQYNVKIGEAVRETVANYARLGHVMFYTQEPDQVHKQIEYYTHKYKPILKDA